jgi:hypothetical protein
MNFLLCESENIGLRRLTTEAGNSIRPLVFLRGKHGSDVQSYRLHPTCPIGSLLLRPVDLAPSVELGNSGLPKVPMRAPQFRLH